VIPLAERAVARALTGCAVQCLGFHLMLGQVPKMLKAERRQHSTPVKIDW